MLKLLKCNGFWLDAMVDVNSIRKDIGLPLHDLFDR